VAIHRWDIEDKDIFDPVFSQWSPMKILLKTRDDPWFIREWYAHHAAIVGPENIIIFDNGSSDPEVLAFYIEVEKTTQIVINSFAMNHIHNVHKNAALYGHLKKSCDYFSVLDTDERLLMLSSPEKVAHPSEIVDALPEYFARGADFVAPLWLGNAHRSSRNFRLSDETELLNSLRWGKPIVGSTNVPTGFINHNCQIGQLTTKVASESRFLVLHLKNLSPEQRISANMRKLENYGFIEPGTSPEQAILCDTNKIKKGDAVYWVNELRSLLQSKDMPEQRGSMTIEDGRVTFRTEESRALLTEFCRDASQFYDGSGVALLPPLAAQV
jgi:hypothetical protein